MLKFLTLPSFLLLITIISSSSIILIFNPSSALGELGNNSSSLSSSSNQVTPNYSILSPTYKIDITTGSGVSYKFQHFYPLKITIPVDTTVAWFNGDPEQIHTVTSDAPGAPNSGKLFNSGIIPYSSSFQYTFDQPGMVLYHCEIHPWMIGSAYVSDSTKQGKNFKLSNWYENGRTRYCISK